MLEYIRLYLKIFGTQYTPFYIGVYIARYMGIHHRIFAAELCEGRGENVC